MGDGAGWTKAVRQIVKYLLAVGGGEISIISLMLEKRVSMNSAPYNVDLPPSRSVLRRPYSGHALNVLRAKCCVYAKGANELMLFRCATQEVLFSLFSTLPASR